MGVRLYSKVENGGWPDAQSVATKCKQVLEDYEAGKDINKYETVKT